MSQIISGPGLGLPFPQALYPPYLQNAPLDTGGANRVGLAPGDQLPIPAGTWYIGTGSYCIVEFLDPVTGIWTMMPDSTWGAGVRYVKSDGFTLRLANRTGCPVSASILTTGSGYVQASTTVTAVGSTSTWQPIVGGALALATSTIVTANAGAGYGVAPLVIIPAPPPGPANPNGVGGVQATAYASIASGTVSGITFTNQGAGYPSTITLTLQPNPTDPNISTGITLATVVLGPTLAGSITGVLCTNPGAPITPANITLTVAGAGTNASITANVMQTVTAASVVGTAIGPFGTVAALLTTVGGAGNAGSITASPEFQGLAFRPRQAHVGLAITGAGAASSIAAQTGTIYDGGLFLSAPNPVFTLNQLIAGAGTISASGTIVLTSGSRADFVTLQPAP